MAQDYDFRHEHSADDGARIADDIYADTESGRARTSPPPSFRNTLRPASSSRSAGRWDLPREGDLLAQRYRVEQVRGQTGHEVVLFATHVDLGQRVLVRVLSPEASEHPDVVTRFQRAARKALENRSEHAERVIDFGRLESGCPYRVSELPHGPSLAEIIEVRGALPIQEVANVMVSACEAVAEVHATGGVYRGLCPSNLFIERRADGTPLVRVVDYGGQTTATHEALAGYELAIPGADLMSTALPYTAPEQLRHPGAVDGRADFWALGAICYELLVGRAPFRAENPVTLLSMIAADQPAPPSSLRYDVPEVIESLVLTCLAKDPELRPTSAAELVGTLMPFASPELDEMAQRVQRILRRSSHPAIPGAASSSLRPKHSVGPNSASAAPQSGHFAPNHFAGNASSAPRSVPSYRSRANMDFSSEALSQRAPAPAPSALAARPSVASSAATPARASVAPQDASQSPWPIAVIAIALSVVGAVVTTVLLRDEVGPSSAATEAESEAVRTTAGADPATPQPQPGSLPQQVNGAEGSKPTTESPAAVARARGASAEPVAQVPAKATLQPKLAASEKPATKVGATQLVSSDSASSASDKTPSPKRSEAPQPAAPEVARAAEPAKSANLFDGVE